MVGRGQVGFERRGVLRDEGKGLCCGVRRRREGRGREWVVEGERGVGGGGGLGWWVGEPGGGGVEINLKETKKKN